MMKKLIENEAHKTIKQLSKEYDEAFEKKNEAVRKLKEANREGDMEARKKAITEMEAYDLRRLILSSALKLKGINK